MARLTAMGFLAVGLIGFLVKVIFIPINQVRRGWQLLKSCSPRQRGSGCWMSKLSIEKRGGWDCARRPEQQLPELAGARRAGCDVWTSRLLLVTKGMPLNCRCVCTPLVAQIIIGTTTS